MATFPAKRFTVEQIQAADFDQAGFCIACGDEAYNVEPDTKNRLCESCGERQVFGTEEIAIMGLVS